MEPVPLLVGDLDDGPIATVTRGGVVEIADGTTIAWWIGAEDRWHQPSDEASTREQRVDGAPVLETLVRVPSGDAAGRVGAARRSGRTATSVLVEVENRSPVPLALAVVVESTAPIAMTPRSLTLANGVVVTLDREAFDHVVAADAAHVLATLATRDGVGDRPTAHSHDAGVVALVAPLPHTATATVCIDVAVADGDAPFDPATVPGLDQVVAGWRSHLAAAPSVEIGDESFESVLRAATCDVLLAGESAPPVAAALVGTPIERSLAAMVSEQRLNGARRGDDQVAATCELLSSIGAWWDSGGDPAHAEPFVVAALAGARWIGSPRRRRSLDGRSAEVRAALGAIVGLLEDAGQHDAAVDVMALAERLSGSGGDPNGGWRADVHHASADVLTAAVAAAARATPDGLRLLDGFEPMMLGRSIDVRNVPTRWGRVAYGVRWHGDRPALLWEILPWDHRPAPTGLRITAPAVDPDWSAAALAGDALLAAPAGTVTTTSASFT